MNVFVDECVTKRLMPYLTGHRFVHATDTTLRSTKNGALLRAIAPDFDVFLTTDRHISAQQNLQTFPLAFVIMRGTSNKLEDLLPLLPGTQAALEQIAQRPVQSGEVYEIRP
jgi:hypothetical protein